MGDDDWDVAKVSSNRRRHYGLTPRGKSDSEEKSNNWEDNITDSWVDSRLTQDNTPRFTKIEVPTKYVGRIIGRRGHKISDLQFESGAKINVTRDTVGENTIIKISGIKDELDKARAMIEELTVERTIPPKPVVEEQAVEEQAIETPIPLSSIDWEAAAAECDRYVAEQWAKLPPIKKNFYVEDPVVANMSLETVEQFREENNNIVVARVFGDRYESKAIPNPVQTFEQAFVHYPEILEEIRKARFETPSPIQCQAWPLLLSGEDMIGIAQTGTGKTLAFLLPALIHIDGQEVPKEERGGPTVLILAPTRELALQIEREVNKYFYRGIKAVCLYGGASRQEQITLCAQGVDIIIATPGRLNDIVAAGHLNVETLTYVVLDEADRMLDLGFEAQIRKVLYKVRPNRQTVMTSATWPAGVRRLADSYMENPVQVYIGTLDLAAVHTVTQIIEVMPDDEDEKFKKLLEFGRQLQTHEKVIVFCSKKARADVISLELMFAGLDSEAMHSNRDQCDREQALADITNGTVQILVATDVASRGIDIEDISHVVNFDFPRNIEEYVHRVGRTGRAGRSGQSISYFTPADWANAKELIMILEEASQDVPEALRQMSKRYEVWKARKDQARGGPGRGRGQHGAWGGGGGSWRNQRHY